MTISIETVAIFASIASAILAVVAIWLALHHYNRAKDVDKSVGESLAGITAQTTTLQAITGRQLDRLTDAATGPRQSEQAMLGMISDFVKQAGTPPSQASTVDAMPTDVPTEPLVEAICSACYFSVMSIMFIDIARRARTDSVPQGVLDLRDHAKSYFLRAEEWLERLDAARYEHHDYYQRYRMVRKSFHEDFRK